MSHNHVHVYIVLLHLILSLALNQKSSQDCTWSSGSPSLLPIVALSLSDLGTCHSSSGSWAVLLGASVVLAEVMPSAVAEFYFLLPFLSPGSYKRGNLVPIHIFCRLFIYLWFFFFYGGPWASDTGHIVTFFQ